MDDTISKETIAEHGLSEEEYKHICALIGRSPNLLELGLFSVMWSEHCSYKSSRRWLKTLPTEGPQVVQGPGENAGAVAIGNGLAAVFKIESHNHPSFIEPYQGAATGVGGILRDVFTMGARPIANLNALRFGAPEHPRTRHLLDGVVAGIGGYGNSIGIPTVGGEVNFDPGYNGNILVNAMTVGIAPADRLFTAKAQGIGNPVIYVGARTGRDGIHGATMASDEFNAEAESRRPTVQVGDPFTEKLLMEACLELMAGESVIAIQDMGAAGLTSSSVEMASKGGVGIRLDLDQVPTRETAMIPYELMLSESQERMLMVLDPDKVDEAAAIFEKWDLAFARVGVLCPKDPANGASITCYWHGEKIADLPVSALVDEAPEYDRPYQFSPPASLPDIALKAPFTPLADMTRLLDGPDVGSRRWIYEQYDSTIGGGTTVGPGLGAAVIQVPDQPVSQPLSLALSVDCTPRYCLADPETGGKQAVAECWRNLVAMGAKPLGLTNNLNFGNPERPLIMGQLVGAINGMREAATELSFPVVSGNVSLYNETDGQAIPPTPVIGGVGVIDSSSKMIPDHPEPDQTLILVGAKGSHLSQSLYAHRILNKKDGPPPPIDLETEKKTGDFILWAAGQNLLSACQDISDGGLLLAVVEMVLAGNCGAELENITDIAFWFGEDQSRYLVASTQYDALLAGAAKQGVPVQPIGKMNGSTITLGDEKIALEEVRQAFEAWLPTYMSA